MRQRIEEITRDEERAEPIPGYDREYWVTTDYRIVSVKSGDPEFVETSDAGNGDRKVDLCRNGRNTVSVERLVTDVFDGGETYPDRRLAIDLHEDYMLDSAEIAAMLDVDSEQVQAWLDAWKRSGRHRPEYRKADRGARVYNQMCDARLDRALD